MPLSKLKHPDFYPSRFQHIIAMGRGVWWLGMTQATEEAARLEMRRFGYFKTSLAKHPRHRLHDRLKGMFIRGSVRLNPQGMGYDVRIVIKTHLVPRKTPLSPIPLTNDHSICEGLREFLSADLADGG